MQRQELGRRAEEAVADYLFARGFRVEATNVRVGRLEIDLVARKGGLLVIVEVRTRGARSYEGALASVSVVKRRRLLTASHRLLAGRLAGDVGIDRVRIDVASVAFKNGVTTVEYIPGAIVDD